MSSPGEWDVFLAYASPDLQQAEDLYEALREAGVRVCFDRVVLRPGDNWYQLLPRYLRDSAVVVALVSSHTQEAHYQNAEIVTAIDLAMREGIRLIPVRLEAEIALPYGTVQLQALEMSDRASVDRVVEQIVPVLRSSRAVDRDRLSSRDRVPVEFVTGAHPPKLSSRGAVCVAYHDAIESAAAALGSGISILVRCEKMLVEHLSEEIGRRSGRRHRLLTADDDQEANSPGRDYRRRLLERLKRELRDLHEDDVIVVSQLDLLAGGGGLPFGPEAHEVADTLHRRGDAIVLAFNDPSVDLPEVVTNRFALQQLIEVLPQFVAAPDGALMPIAAALVTLDESRRFEGFDSMQLYRHIAGMNAIRVRQAVRYAVHHRGVDPDPQPLPVAALIEALRLFANAFDLQAFEASTVTWDSIAGYEDVKVELATAVRVLVGALDLPENLWRELVPRGFVFHGPPGSGKTLFARAVAGALSAGVRHISGPEMLGMDRQGLHALFSEARRAAPAVVVIDEFDSIGFGFDRRPASRQIIALLLAEMERFHPAVPLLIIGITNRLDLLDEMLLRPSRFQPVRIGLPTVADRRQIAEQYARYYRVRVDDELLDHFSVATDGLNGDEIRSVFRDACIGTMIDSGDSHSGPEILGELVGKLRRSRQIAALTERGRRAGETDPAPLRPQIDAAD